MTIYTKEIHEYLSKAEGFNLAELFINQPQSNPIDIFLDDRPNDTIDENYLGQFLFDYKKRCEFLSQIIGLNAENELKKMVSYLDNECDEINIYHYSLLPIKTANKSISIGDYSLVQLDNGEFEKFVQTHPSMEPMIKDKTFPDEYRLLLISQETARRRADKGNIHLWFDRLDEIYSYHSIVVFLMKYYFGNADVRDTSVSTDNYPNAGSSGSTKIYINEISKTNKQDLDKISSVVNFLKDKLFYRLIIRSEITSEHVFQQAIFLRTILDPFFDLLKKEIQGEQKSSGDRTTDIQARIIINFLKKHHPDTSIEVTKEELSNFLKIRNLIIHPDPTDSIEDLHLLYEKTSAVRKTIYNFLITFVVQGKAKGFQIETSLIDGLLSQK